MRKKPTKVSALDNTSLYADNADLLNLTDSPQPTLAFRGVDTSAQVTPRDIKKLYARIETFLER